MSAWEEVKLETITSDKHVDMYPEENDNDEDDDPFASWN